MVKIKEYNELLRRIAVQHSMYYGIDTDESRHVEARLLRELRQDYPFSKMKEAA